MATDEELPLLQELARLDNLPIPDLGLELSDGSVVSIGWEDLKVGVLLDDEDPAPFIAAGWTIIAPDADTVARIFMETEQKEAL